jgi:DNA repair exonuclease SbcCD ATPase subunit
MIELKKLYLDGWLSYDKTELILNTPGITLIRGRIGSGKSAILEAIFYLLFGKTLRGKDSVNSLANRILDDGYEIALDLRIDSNEYTIKEIRARDKKGLYFFKNNEQVILDGAIDPRKAIVAALGMSAQEFESIAFLGQKQAQVLVEGTPGERAKALVTIFGLNRYDDAVRKCMEMVKDIQVKIEKQTDKVEQHNNEIKNYRSMLEASEEYSSTNLKTAKDRLSKVNILISIVGEKIEKLQKIALYNKQKMGMAEAVQDQKEKASNIKQQITALKEKLSEWPDYNITELTSARRELDQERAKCTVVLTHARSEIARINKFGETCPISKEVCPVDIPIIHRSRTLRECNSKISEVQYQLEKISKKINKKTEQIRLAEAKAKIEAVIKNKKEILKTIRIDETPSIDSATEKLNKCRIALDIGNEKIEKLRDEHSQLLVYVSKCEQEKRYKENIATLAEEQEEELQQKKEKLKKLEWESKYLTASLAVLKKTKMYKIDLVINVLNESINEVLEEISDGEYKAQFVSQQNDAKGDRILDKVGIIVTDSHKSIPIELCSGGQKDEVGLSILLATWKTASKITNKAVSSLWLDEAFGSLDPDTIDRVFQAVIHVATELGASAVKVISHRDLDARLFDQVWKVTMKDGITNVDIQ